MSWCWRRGLETTTRGRLFLLGHHSLWRAIEEPLLLLDPNNPNWPSPISNPFYTWPLIASSPASPFIRPPVSSFVQSKWFLMGGEFGGEWVCVYEWLSPFGNHYLPPLSFLCWWPCLLFSRSFTSCCFLCNLAFKLSASALFPVCFSHFATVYHTPLTGT